MSARAHHGVSHRSRPFSAKQKKQQLAEKRAARRGGGDVAGGGGHHDDEDDHDDHIEDDHIPALTDPAFDGGGARPAAAPHTQSTPTVIRSEGGEDARARPAPGRGGRRVALDRAADAHRLVSVFAKLTAAEMEERKAQSQRPFKRLPDSALEIGFDDLYPSGNLIDFPKRPQWRRGESKEVVEAREARSFEEWMKGTYERWPAVELSYFEHNLEVWRQMWRVIEISDIILFVVDARHPILHFPPTLYAHITSLRKKLVLVFNKIDLVDPATLSAWRTYFHALHPSIHTATFSIYPSSIHVTDPRSSTRVKAPANTPRFTRSVGVATVLRACRDVEVLRGGVKVDWDAILGEFEEREGCGGGSGGSGGEGDGSGGGRGGGGDDLDGDDVGVDDAVVVGDDDIRDYDEGGADGEIGTTIPRKDVVTIGLIGHPNVGKSSLINGIMGRKVVSTSRTPGHTKHFQTIHLTKLVRLCDCPGLVFPSVLPKPLQVLSGMYKIAQVQEPYSAVQYLAERIPVERILKLRKADGGGSSSSGGGNSGGGETWSAWDICESFAIQKGFITPRAARPDVYRAANLILRMANDGRLLLGFKPPGFFASNKAGGGGVGTRSPEGSVVEDEWVRVGGDSESEFSGSAGIVSSFTEDTLDDDDDDEDEDDEDGDDDVDELTAGAAGLNAFAALAED